jgi:riboflavin biosynthesis pyrimidine reductase
VTLLRLLLPGPAEVGDLSADAEGALQALADLYAYPDPLPGRGWVRANMIASMDGSATGPDELSGSLGGPADRAVFSALRGLADVVLVGAGTARAEGYRRPTAEPEFADRRKLAGQTPATELALVTRSGELPEGSVDAEHGYVITCAAADLAALTARVGEQRVIVAGTDDVDPVAAVAAMVGRGLPRVLLEGGPRLLGESIATGAVDELCLSLSALLVAGDGPRIAHGRPGRTELVLGHLLLADSLLIGRWLVRR